MRYQRFTRAILSLILIAGLALGYRIFLYPLSAWSNEELARDLVPTLILPNTQRDFGTVQQGVVLQHSFPISNSGLRRLILVEQTEACCERVIDQRRIVLAPGDSTNLTVEVDTAQWHGRVKHTVHYNTNDPKLPRFSLIINADVESELLP
jgi:hypothetical protein